MIVWTNRVGGFSSVAERNLQRLASSSYLKTSIIRLASTLESDVRDSKADDKPNDDSFPRVLLKRNRQSKSFRDGSQLVFSGSIAKVPDSLQLGDLIQVEVPTSTDSKNKSTQIVGWGVYNPNSMYRVRILCHSLQNSKLSKIFKSGDVEGVLAAILTKKFKEALQTRQAMGFPSDLTDTYRFLNGEGDGVSGLAVDVIGDRVAVIMSSAAWCQVHSQTILECLRKVLPKHDIIWKTTPSRLRQDGYAIQDEAVDSEQEDENIPPVIGLENGIKYQAFPHQKGQKTSVYCDQRENRWNLAQLCEGKRVLDLCCYHGGFSLNAAMQGAASVVGVDSSQDAVDTSRSNAEINGLQDKVEFVKADISGFMKSSDSESQRFDIVVLDPPKLAPSVSSLPKASRKYNSLNRDALKLIDEEKGGLFMTCTCSAAMTQKDGGKYFLQMVQQASLAARREITLLRVSGAAPCHTQSPASFPAGNYLTAALFYVHAKE